MRERVQVPGTELTYQVALGRVPLISDERRDIFFTEFTLPSKPGAQRPVTFCFGGGPGASACFVLLSGIGPVRLPLGEDGLPIRGQKPVIDFIQSLLPETDIVFVDPPATGFSSPDPESYGYLQDVGVFSDFIREYLRRRGYFKRGGEFAVNLLGASYGGARAAGIANRLLGTVPVDNLLLLSPSVDFKTQQPYEGFASAASPNANSQDSRLADLWLYDMEQEFLLALSVLMPLRHQNFGSALIAKGEAILAAAEEALAKGEMLLDEAEGPPSEEVLTMIAASERGIIEGEDLIAEGRELLSEPAPGIEAETLLELARLTFPASSQNRSEPAEDRAMPFLLHTYLDIAYRMGGLRQDQRTIPLAELRAQLNRFLPTYRKLLQTGALTDRTRSYLAKRLEDFTGIPASEVLFSGLRVRPETFIAFHGISRLNGRYRLTPEGRTRVAPPIGGISERRAWTQEQGSNPYLPDEYTRRMAEAFGPAAGEYQKGIGGGAGASLVGDRSFVGVGARLSGWDWSFFDGAEGLDIEPTVEEVLLKGKTRVVIVTGREDLRITPESTQAFVERLPTESPAAVVEVSDEGAFSLPDELPQVVHVTVGGGHYTQLVPESRAVFKEVLRRQAVALAG